MQETPENPSNAPAIAALSVYAEPLVAGARVLVIGRGDVEPALTELGARSVRVYEDDATIDVRDGAFDVAILPDLGTLRDPAAVIARLRRLVDSRGAVVAMGRARMPDLVEDSAFATKTHSFAELASATLTYAELYDLFALQFEDVAMTGVLPFSGVVFAELGGEGEVPVSVDTRLVDPTTPDVFVVVAGQAPHALDGYAIVQVEASQAVVEVPPPKPSARELRSERDAEAAIAEAQLRAELLAGQVDEHRGKVIELAALLDVAVVERDAAIARALQLEGTVASAQQMSGDVERRFAAQLAAQAAELASQHAERASQHEEEASQRAAREGSLLARAERAEAELALHVEDLSQVSDANAVEIAAVEAQLRERARVVAELEKELRRREQLVRDLVDQLAEARGEGGQLSSSFEAPPSLDQDEVGRLRRKVDEMALEIARRESELVARDWKIQELSRSQDELDALRQALAQEHEARVAAESRGRTS